MGHFSEGGIAANRNAEPFDVQWYLEQYPDVAMLGMDPIEHYLWVGKGLGRAPNPTAYGRTSEEENVSVSQDNAVLSSQDIPQNITTDPTTTELSDVFSISAPIDGDPVTHALNRFCDWLISSAGCADKINRDAFFRWLEPNFCNYVSDGIYNINPNGRLLIEIMSKIGLAGLGDGTRCAVMPDRETRSILLVSYYAPSLSHAGGLRILDIYSEIKRRNPNIKMTLFSVHHEDIDGNLSILDDVFDEVYFCAPESFSYQEFVRQTNTYEKFDIVDLQFHQAGKLASNFRSHAERLLFTPMESLARSHFDAIVAKLADENQVPINNIFSFIHTAADEISIIESVDLSVCVSDADADYLRQITSPGKVFSFPTGLSPHEFASQLRPDYVPIDPTKKRNRLVFAAYFGSETNIVGLRWYLEQVHPIVLAACPDYELTVVGRGDTSSLEALGTKSVRFIGEVPRLSPVLDQAKAGLVLALNGSGFRGKINQYAVCGLPSVSTSLGATGTAYSHGKDILLADMPMSFAQACIEILKDDSFTNRLVSDARSLALSNYSWNSIWGILSPIYGIPE